MNYIATIAYISKNFLVIYINTFAVTPMKQEVDIL